MGLPAVTQDPPAGDAAAARPAWRFAARRGWGTTTAVVVAANVGFVALLVAKSLPDWWRLVGAERSPLTWFSSIQLLFIALCCVLNGVVARLPVRSLVRRAEWR